MGQSFELFMGGGGLQTYPHGQGRNSTFQNWVTIYSFIADNNIRMVELVVESNPDFEILWLLH